MVMDRIAQIALIFFGLLLLVLLVLGMAVSCRETGADALVTPTVVPFPVTPDDTAATLVVSLPSPTPAADSAEPAGSTPTPGAAGDGTTSGGSATAVPGAPGDAGSPGTTPAPGTDLTQPGSSSQPGTSGTGGIVAGSTARHAVSRGEWLLQIARCYGVTYKSVLSANNIYNPDYILPGAIITVPNVGSQGAITGPPCVVAYTVVTGDTWESLAQRYGTTTAILKRANPGPLTVGRSIWVPRVP